MKIGLIVNPKAGGGLNEDKMRLVSSTLRKLNPDVVFTSQRLFPIKGFRVVDIPITIRGNRWDTVELVKKLDELVDMIVVFGGDGTISDVASAKPKTPLLCIGIGTTNVSPALCDPDFKIDELKVVRIRGLELRTERDFRIAFNDVVVGSTVLATVNGRRVQVDAREFMKGKLVITTPKKFKARVEVGDRRVEGVFGNIFVALTDRRFLGKGIAGGISLSAFLGFKGVVACISEGIVVSTYSKDDVKRLEPITTMTLSFDDEIVKIWADEVISCDGNPVTIGYAEVRVVDDAVTVLKTEV